MAKGKTIGLTKEKLEKKVKEGKAVIAKKEPKKEPKK